jgi:CBS domain-containing protein
MHDVAEFLKAHEPFGGIDETALERLAERAKVEFFTAGTTIFKQGQPPPDEIRVIRKGAVELAERGRVLDLLEDGEMFGQAWMFSGLPTGWEARAREDTLCYALAAEDVLPMLSGPAGLRFVARSLLMLPRPGDASGSDVNGIDFAQQPAGALVTALPVSCEPSVSLREAARRMVETGASSVLVRLDEGELGIVTDHDLRSRVVAEGLSTETAVRDVLTTPVVTARADQPASELMLAMLRNGIRHLPVLSATDEVLGVITDRDLLAVHARTPFVLRRAIADAGNAQELGEAAARLNPTVIALHQGGLAAGQISAIISVVVESLIGRMIELAVDTAGPPPTEFAWLALGSHGRREAVPSSDVDSGMVWDDQGDDAAIAEYMHGIGTQVEDLLSATGLKSDAHGVTASGSAMAWNAVTWRDAIGRWLDEPTHESLMEISILLDGRTIAGPTHAFGVFSAVGDARHRTRMLRLLRRLALAAKPPTGFLHDIVVEHSGEHRGSFDIKQGGLLPIVGIARFGGLAAGAKSTSTVSRLRAAGAAGVLPKADATTLEEAYRLMAALRMEHQVRRLEAGTEPDDHVDPKELNALTRSHLREAFRQVASTQKRLAVELAWSR